MKEVELERLLQTYRDSLGFCERRPSLARGRARRPRRLAWALGTASVAVAVGAVALWPGLADARTLARFRAAIQNARTMEVVSAMQLPSGRWHEFDRIFTRDGMWRQESRRGAGVGMTQIVRGGQRLRDYDRLDHATLEADDGAFGEAMGGSEIAALDFAKNYLNIGVQGAERRVAIRDHAPVDGVPAYLVTLDRAEDDYHAQIVVDRRTDLPITAQVWVQYRGRKGANGYRQRYRFNHPLPDSLFSFRRAKPVVKMSDAQSALERRWAEPLGKVQATRVRDASVGPDGTIWIAVTSPEAQGATAMPTKLSTDAGLAYVRLQDIAPPAILAEANPFTLHGESVTVVGFLPLDTGGALPIQAKVQFARRTPDSPGHGASEAPTEVARTLTLDLRREKGERPDYFVALDLDHFGLQLPLLIWQARAKGLEAAGRLVAAAKAYEQCAAAYRDFVKYAGYRPLREAARLYRSAGMAAEAERVSREADALKASGER